MATGSRSSTKKRILVIGQSAPTSPIELQVDKHNRGVRQRGKLRRCYRDSCARCDTVAPFSPHDVRSRGLRVVVDHPVRSVLCLTVWLARWECPNCGLVFTDYPDFRTPLQALRRSLAAAAGQELLGERPAVLPTNGAIGSHDHRLWDGTPIGAIGRCHKLFLLPR